MTPEQAENWRDFSRRMAEESHRWRTDARRKRVVDMVDDMIECFIDDNGLEMVGDWDGNQVNGQGGKMVERYGRPHLDIAYPCDSFDERLENRNVYHWDEREGCQRHTDFAASVMCCIRAGFDVAVHPSGGVIGSRYTAGMIRRMFPEGLPAYVDNFFHGEGTDPEAARFETLADDVQLWL